MNLKEIFIKVIKKTAQEAVEIAENAFGGGNGAEKKSFAVDFVLNALPFPGFVKSLLRSLLLNVIDEAIEGAVSIMNAE